MTNTEPPQPTEPPSIPSDPRVGSASAAASTPSEGLRPPVVAARPADAGTVRPAFVTQSSSFGRPDPSPSATPPVFAPASEREAAEPVDRSLGSTKKIAAAFLAGAVVTGVGFGIGRLTVEPTPTPTSPAIVDTASPAAPAITDDAGSAPSSTVPVVPASSNPAAAVAQSLGPSVVQIETNLGLGSGVVYAEGLIITNHHVIDNASAIQVRSDDGRAFEAELVGSDARNDIAVLAVGDATGLPVAELGVGELQVGQTAIAIGSPFQLQQTVTAGIVSALDRPVPNSSGGFTAMIQTDTAINPGNSGGALADRDGRVIGINTSIRTDGTSNGNVGIGFAVPITTALDVAERIVAGDSLDPGVLGISGGAEDDQIGVPIGEVTAGGGAAEAGIQVGDRILTVNGAPVSSFQELAGLIQSSFSGDTIELLVQRDGQSDPLTVTATLG